MAFAYDAQSQPNDPFANPEEIATLIVQGRQFTDWETVWVQLRRNDSHPLFRFTCAERDPIPSLWTTLQFKPGDICTIYLGGHMAINGVILTRQVAADANSHGVSLQGVGLTYFAATASIIPPNLHFKGSLMDIANQVLAPTGVKAVQLGDVSSLPFDPPHGVNAQPGQLIYPFLRDLAKHRDAEVTYVGGDILIVGKNSPGVSGNVKEGENIKTMQVVIDASDMKNELLSSGQSPGDDTHHMADASEQVAKVKGDLDRYKPLYTPMEHPMWTLAEAEMRANYEKRWAGLKIYADITVPGWFTFPGSGVLWPCGGLVRMDSDMAMIHDNLAVETVTYQQDRNEGTRTTLHLVEPWRLNIPGGLAGSPSQTAKSDTSVPTSPPAGTPFPTPPPTL